MSSHPNMISLLFDYFQGGGWKTGLFITSNKSAPTHFFLCSSFLFYPLPLQLTYYLDQFFSILLFKLLFLQFMDKYLFKCCLI